MHWAARWRLASMCPSISSLIVGPTREGRHAHRVLGAPRCHGSRRERWRWVQPPGRSGSASPTTIRHHPEVLGDLDELEATDRFRFANRACGLDRGAGRPHSVNAGQSGGGRINVTKVGYGPASIAFAPRACRGPTPRSTPPGRALSRPRAVRPAFPPPAGSATSPMSRSGDQGDLVDPRPNHNHADGTAEQQLMGGAAPFPALGLRPHRSAGRARADSSTTTPGGVRRTAPTRPGGVPRTRPRSGGRGGVNLGAPALGGCHRRQGTAQ